MCLAKKVKDVDTRLVERYGNLDFFHNDLNVDIEFDIVGNMLRDD